MNNAAHSKSTSVPGIPKQIAATALARQIGISPALVRKWVALKMLPGVVMKTDPGSRGGVLLIPLDAAVQFLRARGIGVDIAA
jgi:hypothetical protein